MSRYGFQSDYRAGERDEMNNETNTRHTPGPWRLASGSNGWFEVTARFENCDDAVICARNSWDHNAEQSIANARLIAAAPETAAERDRLREVNAELLAILKEQLADNPKRNANLCTCDLCQRTRAAIAKAEGGAA